MFQLQGQFYSAPNGPAIERECSWDVDGLEAIARRDFVRQVDRLDEFTDLIVEEDGVLFAKVALVVHDRSYVLWDIEWWSLR